MLSALQQYLRRAAAQHRRTIRSGPFLVHLDPHADQPYANYAIPDAGAAPTDRDVAELIALFAAHGRRAAFEYLPACAPAVEAPLVEAGLEVTYRIPVLACEAGRIRTVPAPAGVAIELVDGATSDARLRELIALQYAAFGMPGAEVLADDVARVRASAADGVVAYAAVAGGGEILGGGSAIAIRGGLTELAGIAVAEAARRRGIAAALTSALAQAAAERGARLPFMTPGDDGADRVYRRAGFAPVAEMLHLALPEEAPAAADA